MPAIDRYMRGIIGILILQATGCGTVPVPVLPDERRDPIDTDMFERVARFAHITDAQVVDEESPARLTAASELNPSSWRPHEAYSIHLLDGTVRAINKIHVAEGQLDFVIHTGDATDNVQRNELDWFMTAMDGGRIDPLSGIDDRPVERRPEPTLDPHAAFDAQGLYRSGVHGSLASVPWYAVVGNHDRFALGVLPIVPGQWFTGVAPLPAEDRFDLFFPVRLDPLSPVTVALISPARPGPPALLALPAFIPINPRRRYYSDPEFIAAHLASPTQPTGHGFDAARPWQTFYSATPVPGLRLIVLDSARPLIPEPALFYSEGAVSPAQVRFLENELTAAQAAGDIVAVATHHPSDTLEPVYGTALTPGRFRALLRRFPCVKLHLAGHWHRHETLDRDGYIEMVTSAVIDAPQEGRIVEVWRERCAEEACDPAQAELRYRIFSHLDEIAPPDDGHADLFADPYIELRRTAAGLAGVPPR